MNAETPRVLVLDDDWESMQYLRDHLQETLGWHVELTAEACVLERLSKERFDLLVVDIMIHSSGTNDRGGSVENISFGRANWKRAGIDFLKRLRAGEFSGESNTGTSPDVPVLVLSAVADFHIKDELENDPSIVGYMEKPFRLQELVERMSEALQG